MKTPATVTIIFTLATATVYAQGVFFFANPGAPTRVGSIDGSLAGTNIFGQMLAGSLPDALNAIGMPVSHFEGGAVGGKVEVPAIAPHNFAYVQLVAWDSILWGTTPAGVPPDQLGRTDIVMVALTTGIFPEGTFAPHFTQPAIVPIPEPSVWMLGLLAGGLAFVSHFALSQLRHPTSTQSSKDRSSVQARTTLPKFRD
jgi:hypothetical protein